MSPYWRFRWMGTDTASSDCREPSEPSDPSTPNWIAFALTAVIVLLFLAWVLFR
jgi:hypothetical protein